jgi:hypothetical protein
MTESTRSVFTLVQWVRLALLLSFLGLCPPEAGATAEPVFRLLEPAAGTTVISRRPVIRFAFSQIDRISGYIAILDNVDISAMVTQEGEIFTYTPVEPLPSGPHTLTVVAYAHDGGQEQSEAGFQSRHSRLFQEASSRSEIGMALRSRLKRSGDTLQEPNTLFDASLDSSSTLKDRGLTLEARGHLYYLDRNTRIIEPQERGYNLADYLFRATWEKDSLRTWAETGELHIDASPFTLQGLARRGGQLGIDYDGFGVQAFNVGSEAVVGFQQGFQVGGPQREHVNGVVARGGFFDETLRFTGVYTRGGKVEEGFGETSENTASKGRAYGLMAQSDLFDNRLSLEAEIARSRYDDDTADEFALENDHAWRASASAMLGDYSVSAAWEYVGPFYRVVGNEYMQNDREGGTATAGAAFDACYINLAGSRYHDNVEKDELFARNVNTDGQADITWTGFDGWTIGAGYQYSLQETADEPAGTLPIRLATTTSSGDITYQYERWTFNLNGTRSYQDDRTADDLDTSFVTAGFSAGWSSDTLQVTPMITFTRNRDLGSNVDTDTLTASLNIGGHLWDGKITWDAAGTWTEAEASDHSIDDCSFDASYRVAYAFTPSLWGFDNPSIGIEGRYRLTRDRIANTQDHEQMIYLVLSTSRLISF